MAFSGVHAECRFQYCCCVVVKGHIKPCRSLGDLYQEWKKMDRRDNRKEKRDRQTEANMEKVRSSGETRTKDMPAANTNGHCAMAAKANWVTQHCKLLSTFSSPSCCKDSLYLLVLQWHSIAIFKRQVYPATAEFSSLLSALSQNE